MRPKIEIREGSVQRFIRELERPCWVNKWSSPEAVLAGLEAAMNGDLRKGGDRRKAGQGGPYGPNKEQEASNDARWTAVGAIRGRHESYRPARSNWMSDDEAQELYQAVKDRGTLLDMLKECDHKWGIIFGLTGAWAKNHWWKCTKCGELKTTPKSDPTPSVSTAPDTATPPQDTRGDNAPTKPPSVPEVSEAMIVAGDSAWAKWNGAPEHKLAPRTSQSDECVKAIFRAMYTQYLKEQTPKTGNHRD